MLFCIEGTLGMIMLNSKAQLTIDIIAKVSERKITIANAVKLLSEVIRALQQAHFLKGFALTGAALLITQIGIAKRAD